MKFEEWEKEPGGGGLGWLTVDGRKLSVDGMHIDDQLNAYIFQTIMASKYPAALNPTEEDIQLLLSAQAHLGTKNCDKQMEPYVWKRRADGMQMHFNGDSYRANVPF